MKPLVLLAPLAFALAAPLGAQTRADAVTFPAPEDRAVVGTTPYHEGRLIVRFDGPAGLDNARAALPTARFLVEKPLIGAIDLYLVRVLDATPAADAIRAVATLPGVRYAVADHVVTERQSIPNDTSFGVQWDKHNTGQSGGTVDADIDAPEAWDLGTGSSQYAVAVIDSGFQVSHVDLVDNIFVNAFESGGTPGVDDDANGYVDDVNGWNAYSSNGNLPVSNHGTHVCGIAGASGDNGLGVAGVNWSVTLLPIAGSSSQTSTVLEAYGYACDQKSIWLASGGMKGVNVVSTNSSFGIDFADCGNAPYTAWDDAYDAMGAMGIVSCAATINANVDVDVQGDVPTGCSSDWLISVTNTTRTDAKASAGFGTVTIDLGAPGSSITSTLPSNSYGSLSGTSMATPQVAGAVAFLHDLASDDLASLRDSDPAAAALVMKDILLDTVDPKPALAGITVSGGRLNLHSAALAAIAYDDGVPDGHTHASPELACPTCRPLGGGTGGDLRPRSPARAGERFALEVRAPVEDGAGLLWISTGSAHRGPLRLDPVGRLVRLPFRVEGGRARLSLALPAELAGETLYLQAAVNGVQGRVWTRAWSVEPSR